MNADPNRPRMRLNPSDPRFVRAQELFAQQRPDEGRALLREMLREWLACHSRREAS